MENVSAGVITSEPWGRLAPIAPVPAGGMSVARVPEMLNVYGTDTILLIGGALLGDKVEGSPAPEVRHVQNCTNQVFYENRTTAYNVIYEFAGKQYSVQMPQDPGPSVRLQITPMAPPPAAANLPAPTYITPPPVGMPYGAPPPGSAPQS